MTLSVRKKVEIVKEDGTVDTDPILNGVLRKIMNAPVGVYMSGNRALAIANSIAEEYDFVKKDSLGKLFEHEGE